MYFGCWKMLMMLLQVSILILFLFYTVCIYSFLQIYLLFKPLYPNYILLMTIHSSACLQLSSSFNFFLIIWFFSIFIKKTESFHLFWNIAIGHFSGNDRSGPFFFFFFFFFKGWLLSFIIIFLKQGLSLELLVE